MVIRNRKSKNDRQCNDQKKRTKWQAMGYNITTQNTKLKLILKFLRDILVCRSKIPSFPRSWLITGILTWETRRVPLMEPELLSGVRVTRRFVFLVLTCELLNVFSSFFTIVMSYLWLYDIILFLWYPRTFLLTCLQ